jgi:amino acid permease
MVLTFLIPLLTALISGYLFTKSTDEIGYFAGGIAIISFIICLVLAPWEIQLLLLVLVLASTQKLLNENDYRTHAQDGTNHKLEGRRYRG